MEISYVVSGKVLVGFVDTGCKSRAIWLTTTLLKYVILTETDVTWRRVDLSSTIYQHYTAIIEVPKSGLRLQI